MNIFFDPDNDMVDFLIELSESKSIIDFGTGSGHLLSKLIDNGKFDVIGIDSFVDAHEVMRRDVRLASKFLPYDINEPIVSKLIKGMTSARPSVGFLCRPCHHHLLINTTFLLCQANNMPLYYIGLEKNLERDLDGYDYKIIPHRGTSKENEIIIKLL